MNSREDYAAAAEDIKIKASKLLDKAVFFKSAFYTIDGPRGNWARLNTLCCIIRDITGILQKLQYHMRASEDGEWFDDAPAGLSEQQGASWFRKKQEREEDE